MTSVFKNRMNILLIVFLITTTIDLIVEENTLNKVAKSIVVGLSVIPIAASLYMLFKNRRCKLKYILHCTGLAIHETLFINTLIYLAERKSLTSIIGTAQDDRVTKKTSLHGKSIILTKPQNSNVVLKSSISNPRIKFRFDDVLQYTTMSNIISYPIKSTDYWVNSTKIIDNVFLHIISKGERSRIIMTNQDTETTNKLFNEACYYIIDKPTKYHDGTVEETSQEEKIEIVQRSSAKIIKENLTNTIVEYFCITIDENNEIIIDKQKNYDHRKTNYAYIPSKHNYLINDVFTYESQLNEYMNDNPLELVEVIQDKKYWII